MANSSRRPRAARKCELRNRSINQESLRQRKRPPNRLRSGSFCETLSKFTETFLIEYLHANRHALVNYGRRRRDGLPISTAFAESAVNEILSKRMIKKQQMRWNRWTVQLFLDVRIAVLNKTLRGLFMRRYPAFQADNDHHAVRVAA